MSSGERPIGASKGKQPNTEALCQPPPPPPAHSAPQYHVFVDGLDMPSGLVLSSDGTALLVAEYRTGAIKAFDLVSAELLQTIATPEGAGLSGLAIAPTSGGLFYTNALAHVLGRVVADPCTGPTVDAVTDPAFDRSEYLTYAGDRDLSGCQPDVALPNSSLFEQVHVPHALRPTPRAPLEQLKTKEGGVYPSPPPPPQ